MLDNIEVKKLKLILKFPELSNHLIEKDIFLSEILEYIVTLFDDQKWRSNYYLCGGTALSKCYIITNRLSEDIDLSIFGYTKSSAKTIIKKISVLIDQMEKDNKIIIKIRDNFWNTKRTFLNCEFKYKNHEFSFDVKFIDFEISSKSIQRKNIYNVVEKHDKKPLSSNTLVPVVDIHHIVAEKLLVFDKKYKNEKSGIGMDDEYSTKRLFRHVYDVFMIFDQKLINLIDPDILLVCQIFVKISNKEKDFSTPLSEINLFKKDFFTPENKKVLRSILKSECYGNIKIKDITDFYNQMGEKFKNIPKSCK